MMSLTTIPNRFSNLANKNANNAIFVSFEKTILQPSDGLAVVYRSH